MLESAWGMNTLSVKGSLYIQGRRIVFWDTPSRKRISAARIVLASHLKPLLSKLCTHTKCHGGVKGTIRSLSSVIGKFPFVARFDVKSYYNSISHTVLLAQLEQAQVPKDALTVVRQYLEAPDTDRTGVGLTAGGSLSPLLGAVYLLPLDMAFERLTTGGRIFYRRYMDDIVILAKSRHIMRRAIRSVYIALEPLGLRLHDNQKRYIGRTSEGFDFLGYRLHPDRRLRPSSESMRRLKARARRLYEQGASMTRLRLYVKRWMRWLMGGLDRLVCRKGGERRYWVRCVLTQLGIHDPDGRLRVCDGR